MNSVKANFGEAPSGPYVNIESLSHPLAIPRRIRAQPQRDVGCIVFPDHPRQIIA